MKHNLMKKYKWTERKDHFFQIQIAKDYMNSMLNQIKHMDRFERIYHDQQWTKNKIKTTPDTIVLNKINPSRTISKT